jgi:hypothetical protein
MASTTTRERIRGKTLHFSFTEGPTKGKTYEHAFRDDGTVIYRDAGEQANGTSAGEQADYGAFEIADNIHLVSYLSSSGFTLTLALNFRTGEIAGFASNDTQWVPVKGRLVE